METITGVFGTVQDSLVKETPLEGIVTWKDGNRIVGVSPPSSAVPCLVEESVLGALLDWIVWEQPSGARADPSEPYDQKELFPKIFSLKTSGFWRPISGRRSFHKRRLETLISGK